MIFISIAITLAFFYLVLLLAYVIGWKLCPTIQVNSDFQPKEKISVIIPSRNEELYIENCVKSILANNFPKNLFEIIVINDYSTDKTPQILDNLAAQFPNVKVLHLHQAIPENVVLNSYKKYALNLAINQASGQYIVTTDADCVVGNNWLVHFSFMFENRKANFVTAPVVFYDEKSIFERFQTLDFMGMMCVTGASLHWKWAAMSNGANLGYPKAIFQAVNGFEGVDTKASGDDLLLMEKILKHTNNERIFFLKSKEAIVKTIPARSLKAFFNQRVRWASKSQVYQGLSIKIALLMVLLFNFSVLISFVLWLFKVLSFSAFFIPFAIKMLADFIFLFSISHYFSKTNLMLYFLPAQIWHLLYICSVGIWGNIGTYEWKGRKVN